MNKEQRSYSIAYTFLHVFVSIFYRVKVKGRENLPDGAAMCCASHSSWLDPFMICFACGKKNQLHMMAKAELFKMPVVGWFMKKIGTISVDREKADIAAVKSALTYLKHGEKVGIFPEGTRVSGDYQIVAKSGAVKIAAKAGVPVVPIHIPRKKRIFSRVNVIIGEPYYVNSEKARLSAEEYGILAEELMKKINSMAEKND